MTDGAVLLGAGHCGITESGPSDCTADAKGSWPLRSEHIGSIEACHRRCRQCERCNYVSYSTRNDECAWYYRCPNLRTIGAGGDSYESWRLRHPPAQLSPPPPPPDAALRRDASLDLPRPPIPNPRFAAVGAICNGRSYKGASGTAQIHRAHELGRSIRRSTNRSVDRILFAAGFSADKGARTSHFADHERMLAGIREILSCANANAVPASEVQRLQSQFEKHATSYDGGYADRLSAAIAAQ